MRPASNDRHESQDRRQAGPPFNFLGGMMEAERLVATTIIVTESGDRIERSGQTVQTLSPQRILPWIKLADQMLTAKRESGYTVAA
jgi:hypothetical protein